MPNLELFSFVEIHMGMEVVIRCFADDSIHAERGAKAAFLRFEQLEQSMSDYRRDSEIKLLVQNGVGKWSDVSHDLFAAIDKSIAVARATDGAFDFTAGPIIKLWREARKTGNLPDPDLLAKAKENVGWQNVEIDHRTRQIRIAKPGIEIDMGGVAKGFACDEALAALRREGVHYAAVIAGGDMALGETPDEEEDWPVTIEGTGQSLSIRNKSVSTSGSTEQFVEIGGKRYSHIVDPRTGQALTNRRQATVISRSGLKNDPWATAICVMGDEGVRLATNRGMQCQLIERS
ncbi:MAG: FAD:protein FMN transferase [Armatimonadetes bacterium]|nr:FAD:protein FMN transferase [Armatimonadota bacterium]